MDARDAGSRFTISTDNLRYRKEHRSIEFSSKYASADTFGRNVSTAKGRSISTVTWTDVHRTHTEPMEAYGTYNNNTNKENNENGDSSIPFSSIVLTCTAGFVSFLLSSTIAVSCASVVVGHGTPLSIHVSHLIDMNFLGSAILCFFLAAQSTAPHALGAIDVFVAPILGEMAAAISKHLNDQEHLVVPTVIVMTAATSFLLGVAFYTMGRLHITSFANYIPFPVVAGFLSGVGGTLIRNGLHMSCDSQYFPSQMFTYPALCLLTPALAFAAICRWVQYKNYPTVVTFPILLFCSILGFHVAARSVGMSVDDLQKAHWIFSWSPQIMEGTAMWYSWTHIDFEHVHWQTLFFESAGYFCTLLVLGALKYSVFATSLSTVLGQEIDADIEMKVIGKANMLAGLLGCTGGCHYVSAMSMLQSLKSNGRVPTLICGGLFLVVWGTGLKILLYVPKFVFGGLLLNIGMHFLEAYFFAPMYIVSKLEGLTVCIISLGFICVGMLQSVALGVLICIVILVYRIYRVGCIRIESTGLVSRSNVNRRKAESNYLDIHGEAIHILKLQGFVFFGTSVKILETVEHRILRNEDLVERLQYLIIDFSLVPDFDATALNHFRRLTAFAQQSMFHIVVCGHSPKILTALLRNPQPLNYLHYFTNLEEALEKCENDLIPQAISSTFMTHCCQVDSIADIWEEYLFLQTTALYKKLPSLVVHLDKIIIPSNSSFIEPETNPLDLYFICIGEINVYFTTIPSRDSNISHEMKTNMDYRILQSGSGSLLNMSTMDASSLSYRYRSGSSTCVILRLKEKALNFILENSPHIALDVMRLTNTKLMDRINQYDRKAAVCSTQSLNVQ